MVGFALERFDTRKLVAWAIVLALHVVMVSVFLHISSETPPQQASRDEEILWLPPLPPKKPDAPQPAPDAGPPRETAAPAIAPRLNPFPDYHGITILNAPAAPSLGGLHGALFGCADLDKLSPEARAHCGSALAVPDNSVDIRDGTARSQQTALWERGRLRKNGPTLLPCMSSQGFFPLATAACLAKSAAEGSFKPEEQPSYADKPEITHLPNNGDPPDHPTGF
jgi:hypothetical protein